MRKLKESRRPEIVDAALAVAADRGLDALSMRAVAQRVGVTPMALYGYFRAKDELLEAVVGRLLEEIPPAPPGLGWREILQHLAHGLRSVAGRYPAVLPVLLTRPAVSPGAIRVVDVVYQALLDAGVPPGQVARLERMFSTFVIGHILSEMSGRFGAGTLDPPARRAQLSPEMLPGHHTLGARLDQPVDWDDEFTASLRDMCDLAAALGTADTNQQAAN